MGLSSSRMTSRQSRPRLSRTANRSSLFSSLFCGGSSSRATLEMEDYPGEILVNSADHDPFNTDIRNHVEDSSLISGTGRGSTSSSAEVGASSDDSVGASEGILAHDVKNLNTKCFPVNKEHVAPYQVSDEYNHDESYKNRNSEASTSFKEQHSSDHVSVNVLANKDVVNVIDNSESKGDSQICSEVMQPSSSSPRGLRNSDSDEMRVEIPAGETTTLHSNSDTASQRPDVPLNLHSLGDESIREAIPSGLGFLVSNREHGQEDGSVLHVDVVSISSSIFNDDTSSREARRNSRRLFWDAFSRRSSRRHIDSPTILFSTDDTDDFISHDRWLLDLNGGFFDDGIGSDSGYMGSRFHSFNGRRRHSRSEMWERLRGGLNETSWQNTSCPSGLHPDGACSCESFLNNEESGTRASISRIVMLAEALFEVLDEIHRQPMSLALSMVSLPAPESVVDSFPLKNHKKLDRVEGSNDVEQCYICLAEYEEGDKIRVLPCHHEYHMSCVDKWLKEIHGVCPLCRGDVRQGAGDTSSVSNAEIASV